MRTNLDNGMTGSDWFIQLSCQLCIIRLNVDKIIRKKSSNRILSTTTFFGSKIRFVNCLQNSANKAFDYHVQCVFYCTLIFVGLSVPMSDYVHDITTILYDNVLCSSVRARDTMETIDFIIGFRTIDTDVNGKAFQTFLIFSLCLSLVIFTQKSTFQGFIV